MSTRLCVAALSVVTLVSMSAFAGGVVVSPFYTESAAVNPCTGADIVLIGDGTVRVHESDGHFVAHYSGAVTTSDGGTGRFDVQQVFQGDNVTVSSHDMESYANGDRTTFNLIIHITIVNGEITSQVQNVTGGCLGN